MSILAALVRAYDRMEDAPPFGNSSERIGFIISLDEDGSVAAVIDRRDGSGRKKTAPPMQVPQPAKRTAGIAPNFLWDKTSYALGVTAGAGKRTAQEHEAFRTRHSELLAGTDDAGLKAFLLFLQNWNPDQFEKLGWPEDMKDQNVVFALESERRAARPGERQKCIHHRLAASTLWTRLAAGREAGEAVCLVTGEKGAVARLHPSIKGVWGAQTAGASIVSFNLDAFESYGHSQGDNAPVSERAAFAYTTALNIYLKDDKHRIQIGDASTVFWADTSNASAGSEAEALFLAMFTGPAINEDMQASAVGDILATIRKGRPLDDFAPDLAKGVRFHVLGLAPNAARLSIRFYFEDDFGVLAENYRRYVEEMRIEPPPREPYPGLWRYLVETATLGKRENVPPNLAGEWMRSILTGRRYPGTLLATVLMRMRADGKVNAHRVAILRALLIRNSGLKKEAPVAFDPTNENRGYLLGRLFALYEEAQLAALGRQLNATIKDKFYASASAQPRKVFALLEKGSGNHLSKLAKVSKKWKAKQLMEEITAVMNLMSPAGDPFPNALSAEEQALFGLGYYHQRNALFPSRKAADETENDDEGNQ